jgi:ATP-dependent Lhr-like helicase
LLLPRRRPGQRTPLWQQRLRSAQLLAVARAFPAFPIVVESYRECLQDVFDMSSLKSLLSAIRSRQVRIDVADTHTASPFARSLVFAYVAAYLYDGDAPLAERRAQALALDRNLLRELLGQEELRELLDPEVISELERELQALSDDRKAQHADAVHHLLRRLGALTHEELRARVAESVDLDAIVDQLTSARQLLRMSIAGVDSLVAVEDAALYRDAVGAVPPDGVPRAFLEPALRPIEALVSRWARTHGPFHMETFGQRHGLTNAALTPVFTTLEAAGSLVRGAFLPAGQQVEWCDAEVLRRIKRRTLARLRGEVEPVDRATFARFLPAWHGINSPRKGLPRLEEALVQLEGMPLSYAELERSVLPARVRDFQPRMLDELGAMGSVVWIGCGALGTSDGKVALYRRDRVRKLIDPPSPGDDVSDVARVMLAHLEARGASFGSELEAACKASDSLASIRHDDVVEALWDLVWAGLVTNDTFQPLRALGMRRTRSRRARGTDLRMAGRWSLVSQLIHEPASPTERAHARALMLLERHGLVSREAASLESLPGGFSGVYPVLRSMEEAGKLRRGYFVEGIGGAQFAFPGAVDRLRGLKTPASEPQVTVMSAADPANPYGWIMPWPDRPNPSARVPKRDTGALLVLVDGEPTLYLARGGHALLTFAGQEQDALERGLDTLRELLSRHGKKSLRIEEIDGELALRSTLAPTFKELGISFDHRGFIIEREV